MHVVFSFLKGIRFLNLLITLMTMVIANYCLLIPQSKTDLPAGELTTSHFWMLALSVLCIMAGGNIINDYFDQETDALNQRHSNFTDLTGRALSLRIYFILSAIGLALGLVLSLELDVLFLWSIQLLAFLLLLLYSTRLKSLPFLGNFTVAILCGLIPALPLIFAGKTLNFHFDPQHFVLNFLCLFAFLLTMIREMTKDIEDLAGDRAARHLTVPVLFGTAFTKFFINLLSVLLLFLLIAVIGHSIGTDWYSTLYLTLGVLLPFVILLFKLNRSTDKLSFHHVSTGMKGILLSGLLYAYFYSVIHL